MTDEGDDIRRSHADPILYGWNISHLGESATKNQLRRALLVVLQAGEKDRVRLGRIEPLARAVEGMIATELEQRND